MLPLAARTLRSEGDRLSSQLPEAMKKAEPGLITAPEDWSPLPGGHLTRSVDTPPYKASTSGNPSQQHGATWASTKNPLENLTQHKSAGLKKDLDFFMGAYFQLNHPTAPEGQWKELKTKFFEFLGQC